MLKPCGRRGDPRPILRLFNVITERNVVAVRGIRESNSELPVVRTRPTARVRTAQANDGNYHPSAAFIPGTQSRGSNPQLLFRHFPGLRLPVRLLCLLGKHVHCSSCGPRSCSWWRVRVAERPCLARARTEARPSQAGRSTANACVHMPNRLAASAFRLLDLKSEGSNQRADGDLTDD